ncbi:MAG: hypothetical protein C0515_00085 [Novosphingobium sp.]|nr:hypothetical protein [Novosphingobium sp.]
MGEFLYYNAKTQRREAVVSEKPFSRDASGDSQLSSVINFRADPDLLAALRVNAERDGRSVSEIIRSALRDKVTFQ